MTDADRSATLYAACLGELGQLGNQLFQYAFALAYTSTWKLRLCTPVWVGSFIFEGADPHTRGPSLPMAESRIILADRVVLSHAGWKRWAERREPLASIVRDNAGASLSGRKLRQECPQVNAASIASQQNERACTGCGHVEACVARGGCLELWGFFQFHTRQLAPHRPLLVRALRPIGAVRQLVEAVLGELRTETAAAHGVETREVTLVCVHVRCKDDVLPLCGGDGSGSGGTSAYRPCEHNHAGADVKWRRPQGPAAVPADGPHAPSRAASSVGEGDAPADASVDLPSEWRDEGVFWAAPVQWHVEWLRRLWPTLRAPTLLLCTDHAERALNSGLCEFAPTLLPSRLREQASLWEAAHVACGHELTDGALEMVADWEAMRRADVLAINQSTFSFTAAMAAATAEGGEVAVEPAREPTRPRWWRPDPMAGALVSFEPWDSPVLLNACESGTEFRKRSD